MNCDQYQKHILLSESGELAPNLQQELDRHMSACPACAGFRKATRRICAVAAEHLPAPAPGPATLARIRSAAEERLQSRVFWFRIPVVQALAAAALLLVMVGAWMALWTDSRTNELAISDVHTIAISMMPESETSVPVPADASANRDAQIRALAAHLMELEGFPLSRLDSGT